MDSQLNRFTSSVEVDEIALRRFPERAMIDAQRMASNKLTEQVQSMYKFNAYQNPARQSQTVFASLVLPEKIVRIEVPKKLFKPKTTNKSFYQRLKEEIDVWIKS